MRRVVLTVIALLAASCARARAEREAPKQRVLRVCADPNNLPFSNEREEGFENALARLVARELRAAVSYTWWAQRRGFIRNTLKAGSCDVVMGVPKKLEMVDTTDVVYRSTYVFVSRAKDGLAIRSLDDPRLSSLRVGVHVIGDDYANSPPLHALSRRGIVDNVVGFRLLGDYREENPPARLVEAVADGRVDVAIVWGPFGGYFGAKQSPALAVERIAEEGDGPTLPFAYDIALGVRRGDALRDELNGVLRKRREAIAELLAAYRVPTIPRGSND